MNHDTSFAIALLLLSGISMWLGHNMGYRKGYDDCDFEHDFDRCPHCGESLP